MLHDKDRVSIEGNWYLDVVFETFHYEKVKNFPQRHDVRMMQRGSTVQWLGNQEAGSYFLLCY